MKTNCKRLLSLAVALVMILVMIPVSQLEVKADFEVDLDTVNDSILNEDGTVTAAASAQCPVCGATNVEWIDVTTIVNDAGWVADSNGGKLTVSANKHYYMPHNTTFGSSSLHQKITITGGTVCVYLGNKKDTDNGQAGSLWYSELRVTTSGALNLFGRGTVRRSGTTKPMVVRNQVEVNIYGGEFIGASSGATTNGGTIDIQGTSDTARATVNIYDATVRAGQVKKSGSSARYGGNIFAKWANVTINGGSRDNNIRAGKAQTGCSGGNIYATIATITVNNDAEITTGNAAENGGNIALANGAELIMNGGAITDGNAKFGGNICAETSAVITMNGGRISGGKATRGGNVLLTNEAQMTVGNGAAETDDSTKAIVTGGISNTHGGNIYVYNKGENPGCTLTVQSNGRITAGEAYAVSSGSNVGMGGNVYMDSGNSADNPNTLIMTGGQISGGMANANGGNVVLNGANAQFLMSAGTIQGGMIVQGPGPNADDPDDQEYKTKVDDSDVLLAGGAKMAASAGNSGDVRISGEETALILRNTASANKVVSVEDGKVQLAAGWSGLVTTYYDLGEKVNEDETTEQYVDLKWGEVMPNVQAGNATDSVLASGTPTVTFAAADVAYTGKLQFAPPAGSSGASGKPAIVLSSDTTDTAGTVVIANYQYRNLTEDTSANVIWANDLSGLNAQTHYVRLINQNNIDITLTQDTVVDVNGRNINFVADSPVQLSLLDAKGTGDVTLGANVTLKDRVTQLSEDVDYVVMDNDDGESVTAHKVSMKFTNVLLSTEKAGFAFQAEIVTDDTVKANMEYGIVASLDNMPGEDFAAENVAAGENINAWTYATALPEDGVVNGHGIMNILAEGCDIADVTAKAYTNLYMTIKVSNDPDAAPVVLLADTENVGAQAGIGVSLWMILKAIDSNWDSFEANQQQVNEFVAPYADLFTGEYAFTNIGAENA